MTAMMGFMVEEPRALAGTSAAPALVAWLDHHRPQLLDFHQDARHFGNVVMILAKNGLEVRFVVDRGDMIVDVGRGGRWVSERNVDAFMRSVPATEGRSWPDFDPFDETDAVLEALSSPRLSAFLQSANVEALAAMGIDIATA